MQLIKGGGCHGGVIWLTLSIRQSKAQGVVICYESITCPCKNPCSVSGRSTHVLSGFCVINRSLFWYVTRTVRTRMYRVVVQTRLWNHGCGICYLPVSGSRFGSSRARWAFHWSFDTETLFMMMRRCSWCDNVRNDGLGCNEDLCSFYCDAMYLGVNLVSVDHGVFNY